MKNLSFAEIVNQVIIAKEQINDWEEQKKISNIVLMGMGEIDNLSFEREFGKMIGRLDYFSYTLSEKTQRAITRMIQNITTGILLPFI